VTLLGRGFDSRHLHHSPIRTWLWPRFEWRPGALPLDPGTSTVPARRSGQGGFAPSRRWSRLHPQWFELAYAMSTIHLFELGCRQDSNDGQGLCPWTPAPLPFPLGALAKVALPPLAADRGFTPNGSNWRMPCPPFTYSNLAVAKIRMTARNLF